MEGTYQFSESTMLTVRVVTSVLQSIGILVSLFRLWFRLQIRRLWWEDAWASIVCICAIILVTSEWMYLKGDWEVSVVGFWGYISSMPCVIWAARMSILFSIARIVHPTERTRQFVTAVATLFSVIFLTFMALKLWWFTRDLSWLKETAYYTKPALTMPMWLFVYQLCSDCVADLIIISSALQLLRSMNLPKKQRTMISAIFSSGIIVTMVSVFRGVTQLMKLLSLAPMAADLEVAFSIIACNLLVVVTLIYRCSRSAQSSDAIDDDDYTPSGGARFTTTALTTVVLSAVICSEDGSQRGTVTLDC